MAQHKNKNLFFNLTAPDFDVDF